MVLKVNEVMKVMEEIVPLSFAENDDNIGLVIGSKNAQINGILLSLDLNLDVAKEAVEKGCNLIITHHPPIFEPLRKIRGEEEALFIYLLKNDLNIYSAHTNWDIVPGGLNDFLANIFELKNIEILEETGREKLYKLVVFIPEGYEEKVRQAIGEKGAGFIGNYSFCTFQTPGTGTFLPLEGTNPFIGEIGKIEYAKEYRLETIVPQGNLNNVLQAMIDAHPYEEVAYDLYPLANEGKSYGLGRIGNLDFPISLREIAQKTAGVLNIDISVLKIEGELNRRIERMAVCGGAGKSLIPLTIEKGADLYLTADIDYHSAQKAKEANLALIDAGHGNTERPSISFLRKKIEAKLKKIGEIRIEESKVFTEPWQFLR